MHRERFYFYELIQSKYEYRQLPHLYFVNLLRFLQNEYLAVLRHSFEISELLNTLFEVHSRLLNSLHIVNVVLGAGDAHSDEQGGQRFQVFRWHPDSRVKVLLIIVIPIQVNFPLVQERDHKHF